MWSGSLSHDGALSLTAISNKGETLSLETSVMRRQVRQLSSSENPSIACAVKSKRLALALEFNAMMAQGTQGQYLERGE